VADLLIAGGCVVTMDPRRRVIDDGALAIESGAIVAIGPTDVVRRAHPADRTIDATNKVVVPGFVDLHADSGGGLLKTIGEHLDGADWRRMNARIFQHFTDPEYWSVEGQLHALERLRFGTTAIHSKVGGSGTRTDDPRYVRATAAAFESVGIRAQIGLGPTRPPWPQAFSDYENGRRTERMVDFEQVIAVCDEILRQARERPSELITYCTSLSRLGNRNPHDPMWIEEHGRWVHRQADALRGLMDEYDVGFWTHIYGDAVEFAVDEQLGLLGPKTILSHATGITPRGVEIIAETGCHVAHSPRARRIYSYTDGHCPVVELVDAGVNVALGSDGPPPDRNCDVYLDMKMAISLQRLRHHDRRLMPPGLALEMASINGYRALGLDHVGGSLEVGKRADVVLVDFFKPHLVPLRMPVHQLVYHATGADVDTVLVDGKVLIEGRVVRCVDETDLLRRAQELSDRTILDAGLGDEHTGRPEGFWGRARY
jgi:5-methylthioadenosine/S-adenosylhomocysteine deaminase